MQLLSQGTLMAWVDAIGYVGLSAIVFTETGIFFGALLPGDTLLFAAGLLSAQHLLKIYILVPLLILMAFCGYIFGYWFGERLGNWLVRRKDGFWYKRKYLNLAHKFYRHHGAKAILLGRMIPVMRTFGAIIAGTVRMNYRRFLIFNFFGALLWISFFCLLGYYVGDVFPQVSDYLLPVAIAMILIIAFAPMFIEFVKSRSSRK